MTDTETAGYLAHHLKLVGRSDTLFSDDATALIHQVSRGLPRAVNNLAIQALVAAYATTKSIVGGQRARTNVVDRMIAAVAAAHSMPLISSNAAAFRGFTDLVEVVEL